MKVATGKKDIIWNYLGTISSMASSFILLPFLLHFLTSDDLGLWYVFIAISNFSLLFDLGFTPTLSRTIVYCISGARRLTNEGCDFSSIKPGIDFALLGNIFKTTSLIYAFVAIISLISISFFGTLYIGYITSGLNNSDIWIAWVIICVSVFLNLYFLKYITFIRGLGDIASENKSKTFSRCIQLVSSIAFLVMGFGIIGASLGYFIGGLLLRVFSRYYLGKHDEIIKKIKNTSLSESIDQVKHVFKCIFHIAWRDGIVQISTYLCSQATILLCSLFLGLEVTGTYSVLLQLATATGYLSSAFCKTYLPMYQSAFAHKDAAKQKEIIEHGITVFWVVGIICTIGVVFVVFPILAVIRPDIDLNIFLYIMLSLYMLLWNNHSLFCCFIISTNRIPYMRAFLISSLGGILLSLVFINVFKFGIWGLVFGELISQAVYNNWRWPQFVDRELQVSYFQLLRNGFVWLFNKMRCFSF